MKRWPLAAALAALAALAATPQPGADEAAVLPPARAAPADVDSLSACVLENAASHDPLDCVGWLTETCLDDRPRDEAGCIRAETDTWRTVGTAASAGFEKTVRRHARGCALPPDTAAVCLRDRTARDAIAALLAAEAQ